jgi:adenine-specific DNA-methyltransferase
MTAILEAEATRLTEQRKLDRFTSAKERNKWGQFATPPALSLDIARYAWNKLKRRKGGFRFLDPALGTGSFFGAFLQAFSKDRIEAACGIELDYRFAESAKSIWHKQGLKVVQGDFTKQKPAANFNIILSNPPYVRHHHINGEDKQRLGEMVQYITGLRLSGLAGLYCYFLLIAHAWLAEDGLSIWLIPSEFMDVNYGEEIKRYLTEKVSLLQIHRFRPSDVQFDDALVSSAIIIFEKRKPSSEHEAVISFGDTLSEPAKSEKVSLDQLRLTKKWTSLPHQGRNGHKAPSVTLGDLFTVKRGLATGNNGFFIVPRDKLAEFGIPDCCVRPILPSPRFLKQEIIDADAKGWPILDRQLALIDCGASEEEIRKKWPRFAHYLSEGKKQAVHEGYLASHRTPWYSQEKRETAPFACTYMGRNLERPFRFIWNRSQATVANVYLMLYPREFIANKLKETAKEVFDALRAIHPDHFFNQGRVYGGGLHKMEPAELMRLPADGIAGILGVSVTQQLGLFQA